MNYIDVSEWQGEIDWEAVKPNIDGAILRAGYGKNHPDKQFARNAAECNRLGVPIGAYWFSYAKNVDEAKAEAEYLLAAVKPYRMELPLAFDFEYDSVNAAAKAGVTISKSVATMMVYAFCETVEQSGYWCLNYANPDFLSRYFSEDVPKRFGLWLAEWGPGLPSRVDCAIWQYSSKGVVPGIRGDVDMDIGYTDFASVIRERGLNHLNELAEGAVSDMEWARKLGLIPEVAASEPVTWGGLFRVLRKLHKDDE